jgi:hypothetical protein
MRIGLLLGTAGALITFIIGTGSAPAAGCPAGKMTCAAWCAKYRPGAQDCLAGAGYSCATKPGGNSACVGDICNPSNDSCRRLQDQEINLKKLERSAR